MRSADHVRSDSQICTSLNAAQFGLTAVYTNPPSTGPSAFPLKFLDVYTVPHEGWAIISVSCVIRMIVLVNLAHLGHRLARLVLRYSPTRT